MTCRARRGRLHRIPAGGLFTGAEWLKTAADVTKYGGVQGAQYDPCYHEPCASLDPTGDGGNAALYAVYDLYGNINTFAIDVNAGAAATAVISLAYDTSAVNGTPTFRSTRTDIAVDFGQAACCGYNSRLGGTAELVELKGVVMATKTMAMLDTRPGGAVLDKQLLTRCIETCLECLQACTACTDADLNEQTVAELVKCARLNLDCADMCDTTARVLTRQTGYDRDLTRAVVQACAQACKVCGDECDRHAQMHEHCRVCAEVCHRCQQVCEEVLAALG